MTKPQNPSTPLIKAPTPEAAKTAWARLPEKSRRGVVAQAYARVFDLLNPQGDASLTTVLETLFPEEPLEQAHLALKTQFSNRPPKLAKDQIALQLKTSRVSLQAGEQQAASFAKAVVWFEIPARVDAANLAPVTNPDVAERFGETLASKMLGSEIIEHTKSEDLRKAELDQAESKSKATLNNGAPYKVHGIGEDAEDEEFGLRQAARADEFEESLALQAKQLSAGDGRSNTAIAVQTADENHPVALHAMLQWAQDSEPTAQRLLVLLGDYGTGKTSHGQQFTRVLNNKIDHPKWPREALGEKAQKALFIDLSELSGVSNLAGLSLEEMLVLVLKKRDGVRIQSTSDIAPLLADARAGRLIMVFDGLDELLKNDSLVLHKVFDQILRVIEPSVNSTSTQQPKAIISCRSHYFRDIEAQHSFFTARSRGGVTGSDYLMLTLLPWGNELIESYLSKRLGNDAPRLIKIIHNTYNLEELATRPVLLSMMSEHIMALLKQSDESGKITAADLYNLTVASWIERDNGKHRIRGHQKPLLMGALAAAMLDSEEEAWPVDRLDAWLLRTIHMLFPGNYEISELASIQEDLRTATFIVRTGARGFSFAHKSYSEYFVARFILDGVDQVRYGNMAAEQFHRLLPVHELNREATQFLTELWKADCQRFNKRDTVARAELLIGILQREEVTKPAVKFWLSGMPLLEIVMKTAPGLHRTLWKFLLFYTKSLFNELSPACDKPINLRGLAFRREVWADADLHKLPALNLCGAILYRTHAQHIKFGKVICDDNTDWSWAVLRNCDTKKILWNDAQLEGLRLRTTNTRETAHYLNASLAGAWTVPIAVESYASPMWPSQTEYRPASTLDKLGWDVLLDFAVTTDCVYLLRLANEEVVTYQPKEVNNKTGATFVTENGDACLTAVADGSIFLWNQRSRQVERQMTPENKTDKNGNLIRRYSVPNPPPPFEPSWAEFDEQGRLLAYNDAAAEHWLFRIRDGVAEPIEAAL